MRLREEERHLGTMINCLEHDPQKKKQYFDHQKYKVSSLKRELKAVEEQLEITLKRCNWPFRSGPVTSSLDEAIKNKVFILRHITGDNLLAITATNI